MFHLKSSRLSFRYEIIILLTSFPVIPLKEHINQPKYLAFPLVFYLLTAGAAGQHSYICAWQLKKMCIPALAVLSVHSTTVYN